MIALPTKPAVPVRPHVTNAQIDRCHPIWNCQTGSWFYHVESESDPTRDYAVHYYPETDSYTCTCPCGQDAFASCHLHQYCKHVYWACAHYQRFIRPQYTTDVQPSVSVSVADALLADVPELPRGDVAPEDNWLNEEKYEPLTRWHNWLYYPHPKQR